MKAPWIIFGSLLVLLSIGMAFEWLGDNGERLREHHLLVDFGDGAAYDAITICAMYDAGRDAPFGTWQEFFATVGWSCQSDPCQDLELSGSYLLVSPTGSWVSPQHGNQVAGAVVVCHGEDAQGSFAVLVMKHELTAGDNCHKSTGISCAVSRSGMRYDVQVVHGTIAASLPPDQAALEGCKSWQYSVGFAFEACSAFAGHFVTDSQSRGLFLGFYADEQNPTQSSTASVLLRYDGHVYVDAYVAAQFSHKVRFSDDHREYYDTHMPIAIEDGRLRAVDREEIWS